MIAATLAQGVVELVAKGVEETEAKTKKTAKAFAEFTTKAQTQLGNISKSFAGLAVVTGGFFAVFSRAAMAGTVEGERFAKMAELASRSVGDMFAPVIRLATEGLRRLTVALYGVDPATKALVGGIVAGVASMATFLTLWPKLLAVISPVLAIVSAIASPLGIMVAAFAAIGFAIQSTFAPFSSWQDLVEKVVQGALTAWDLAKEAFQGLMESMKAAWDEYGAVVVESFTKAWEFAEQTVLPIITGLAESVMGFFGSSIEQGLSLGSVFGTIAEAVLDVYSVVEMLAKLLTEGVMYVFRGIADAATWSFGVVNGWIKSVMKYWGITTDSIKFTWKDAMKFVGNLFLGVVSLVASGVNLIVWPFKQAVAIITDTLAWLGEKTRVISSSTAEEMRKFAKSTREFQLIDTDALTNRLGAASLALGDNLKSNADTAKKLATEVDNFANATIQKIGSTFASNEGKAKSMVNTVKQGVASVFSQAKQAAGSGGFRIKADIGFEGIQGTFDRIQKALANASGVGKSVEEAQLQELKAVNEGVQKVADSMDVVKRAVPAIV